MKSKNSAKTIILLLALSACNCGVHQYPVSAYEKRMTIDSGAYNKALGQSIAKKGVDGQDCYYRQSGCTGVIKTQPAGMASKAQDVSNYPKDGYVLGNDGKYHFSPAAVGKSRSRN